VAADRKATLMPEAVSDRPMFANAGRLVMVSAFVFVPQYFSMEVTPAQLEPSSVVEAVPRSEN